MKRKFTVYLLKSDKGSITFSREAQAKKLGAILDTLGYDYVIDRVQRVGSIQFDEASAEVANSQPEAKPE